MSGYWNDEIWEQAGKEYEAMTPKPLIGEADPEFEKILEEERVLEERGRKVRKTSNSVHFRNLLEEMEFVVKGIKYTNEQELYEAHDELMKKWKLLLALLPEEFVELEYEVFDYDCVEHAIRDRMNQMERMISNTWKYLAGL